MQHRSVLASSSVVPRAAAGAGDSGELLGKLGKWLFLVPRFPTSSSKCALSVLDAACPGANSPICIQTLILQDTTAKVPRSAREHADSLQPPAPGCPASQSLVHRAATSSICTTANFAALSCKGRTLGCNQASHCQTKPRSPVLLFPWWKSRGQVLKSAEIRIRPLGFGRCCEQHKVEGGACPLNSGSSQGLQEPAPADMHEDLSSLPLPVTCHSVGWLPLGISRHS